MMEGGLAAGKLCAASLVAKALSNALRKKRANKLVMDAAPTSGIDLRADTITATTMLQGAISPNTKTPSSTSICRTMHGASRGHGANDRTRANTAAARKAVHGKGLVMRRAAPQGSACKERRRGTTGGHGADVQSATLQAACPANVSAFEPLPPPQQQPNRPTLEAEEALRTLPEAMRAAFEQRSVHALSAALAALPRDEATYHMKRCIEAGFSRQLVRGHLSPCRRVFASRPTPRRSRDIRSRTPLQSYAPSSSPPSDNPRLRRPAPAAPLRPAHWAMSVSTDRTPSALCRVAHNYSHTQRSVASASSASSRGTYWRCSRASIRSEDSRSPDKLSSDAAFYTSTSS